jgi:hypothetical protein
VKLPQSTSALKGQHATAQGVALGGVFARGGFPKTLANDEIALKGRNVIAQGAALGLVAIDCK